MPQDRFLTDNEATVKAWRRALNAQVVLNDHQLFRLDGPYAQILPKKSTPSKAICYDRDLESGNGGRGDQIRHFMAFAIQHAGAAGEEELEGHEAKLDTASYNYTIDLLRFGIADTTPMNKQRVPFEWVKNQTPHLVRHCTRRKFFAMLAHLAGYEGISSGVPAASQMKDDANQALDFTQAKYNVNNSITATAATCWTLAGTSNAADEDVDSEGATARPTLAWLDKLLLDIEERRHPLLPCVEVDGVPMYPMLVDSRVLYWLKQDSNWKAVRTNLLQGGHIKSNPTFTGFAGIYERLIFISIHRGLPYGFDSTAKTPLPNVRRCVVLGVDALNIAYGLDHSPTSPWDLWHGQADGGKEERWHCKTICGMKRPQYQDPNESNTAYDVGTHVFSCYADAP